MSMIVYILKVSVSLALFWLMYRLVFKRLTFFAFNRFFLLGSVLLSFMLPLVRFMDHPHAPSPSFPGLKIFCHSNILLLSFKKITFFENRFVVLLLYIRSTIKLR